MCLALDRWCSRGYRSTTISRIIFIYSHIFIVKFVIAIKIGYRWSILQTKDDLIVGLGDEDDRTSSGKLRYYLENGVRNSYKEFEKYFLQFSTFRHDLIGIIYVNKMCDLVVGTIVPIHSRFEWMDFLHGHMDGSAALIIKKAKIVNENINAIAKPFQPWVLVKMYTHFVYEFIWNVLNSGLGRTFSCSRPYSVCL